MPSGFVATSKNPQVLVDQINLSLNKELRSLPSVYERIAFVDRTSKAETVHYPMQVATSAEIERGPTEETQFSDAAVIDIVVKAVRIEPEHGTMIPVGEMYDPYNIIKLRAPGMVRQVSKIWDRRLAVLLRSNGVAYDNAPFFGTHATNLNFPGGPTFTNDFPLAKTTEAGMNEIFDALTRVPGFDGTFMNQDAGRFLILCPNRTIATPLRRLFHEQGGLISEQVATAAAGVSTVMGGEAEVIVMPELYDRNNPISERQFYVFNTALGERQGLIVRELTPPQFYMTGRDSEQVMLRNALLMKYVTFGGVGFGLPQLMMRCTLA